MRSQVWAQILTLELLISTHLSIFHELGYSVAGGNRIAVVELPDIAFHRGWRIESIGPQTVPANYFVLIGNKIIGPMPGPDLKQLALSGELSAGDIVWEEGSNKKVKARNISGLFDASLPLGTPQKFYYRLAYGEEIGPLTGVEIREAALCEKILPSTSVRVDDSIWVSACQIRGLFDRDGVPLPHPSENDGDSESLQIAPDTGPSPPPPAEPQPVASLALSTGAQPSRAADTGIHRQGHAETGVSESPSDVTETRFRRPLFADVAEPRPLKRVLFGSAVSVTLILVAAYYYFYIWK